MNIKLKILSVILLTMMVALVGKAQEAKPLAEVVSNTEKIVKNAPFSAESITENIQTFADGNKIVRRSVTKMYRDSEGRFRREEMPQPNGNIGLMVKITQTILIIDPKANFRYFLNPGSKTIRQTPLGKSDLKFKNALKMNAEKVSQEIIKKKEQIAEKKAEINAQKKERMAERRAEINAQKSEITDKNSELIEQKIINSKRSEIVKKEFEEVNKSVQKTRNEAQETVKNIKEVTRIDEKIKKEVTEIKTVVNEVVKIESLGVRKVEGVEAEGTRSTKTIEAGAIGNERPINIVYEKWYSKDLQLIVMSKHSDPRFGENIYRLTNIQRHEPDASLFILPNDYKITDDKKTPRVDPKEPRLSKPRTNPNSPNSPKPPAVEKKPFS